MSSISLTARSSRTLLQAPRGWLFGFLMLVCVIGLLSISNLLLLHLGIQYDTAGGSAFEKIHPSSIAVALTFLLLLFAYADPAGYLDAAVTHFKGTLAFLLVWVLLLFHVVFIQKEPFTPIIDTFLVPVLFFAVFQAIDQRRGKVLAWAIHLILVVNAVIGIYEYVGGDRLTPLIILDKEVEDWRSTALLGHPLSNSCITGAYLVALATGGGRDLPLPLRWLAFAACFTAMFTFGGRVAFLSVIAAIILFYASRVLHVLRGGRFTIMQAILAMLFIPAALLGLLMLFEFEILDKFLQRFQDDQGSAEARMTMLKLFSQFSLQDYLFGTDPKYIDTFKNMEGLEFGIESFWLAYIYRYGLIVSAIFFTGLLFFMRDVVRSSGQHAIWVLFYFFGVASTSVSLAAKATWLSIIVVFVMVLYRASASPGSASRQKAS